MAKAKSSVFFCQECGYESAKWMGQCPACHAWNTFVEEKLEKTTQAVKKLVKDVNVTTLDAIKMQEGQRIKTEISELDRVLGGGIVQRLQTCEQFYQVFRVLFLQFRPQLGIRRHVRQGITAGGRFDIQA